MSARLWIATVRENALKAFVSSVISPGSAGLACQVAIAISSCRRLRLSPLLTAVIGQFWSLRGHAAGRLSGRTSRRRL